MCAEGIWCDGGSCGCVLKASGVMGGSCGCVLRTSGVMGYIFFIAIADLQLIYSSIYVHAACSIMCQLCTELNCMIKLAS